MSIRKRNEFLEGDESDGGSDVGYDSEAAEESRGALTGRASKRRKLETNSGESGPEDDGDAKDAAVDARFASSKFADADFAFDDAQDEGFEPGDAADDDTVTKPHRTSKAPKSVTAAQKAAKRSGVVYISRVPPFMKPQTLKHLLAPHAPSGLGRVFLTPEDHAAHARRVHRGGNKKKSFTDGWVEFASKREAKVAAELLNGNIIGGKKGGFYHDDLWCVKYLRSFKWAHLTEQVRNEDAERAVRMKEEVKRTKEENRRFVEGVERGKMLEGMEGKRRAKGLEAVGAGGEGGGKGRGRGKSEFKQRKVQGEKGKEDDEKQAAEFLQRAGGKIF